MTNERNFLISAKSMKTKVGLNVIKSPIRLKNNTLLEDGRSLV